MTMTRWWRWHDDDDDTMMTMTRWWRWHDDDDDTMRRWGDEAMMRRWKAIDDFEPWTMNLENRYKTKLFFYKDGLRPICLRHCPGLRPPLLKEGELRFAAPFSRGQQSQTTNRYCLVSGFKFQVSNLFIFSSPHLFISSSSHLFISSSFHLLIFSSSHRLIVFHRLIASSPNRVTTFHYVQKMCIFFFEKVHFVWCFFCIFAGLFFICQSKVY